MNKDRELSRRTFMSGLLQSSLGLSLLPMTGLQAGISGVKLDRGRAQSLIYLYMAGGMSHVESFDPKSGAEVMGPFSKTHRGKTGEKVGQLLPLTAGVLDRIAVIRSMTHPTPDHGLGSYYMSTGYSRTQGAQHPYLGSWICKLKGRRHSTLPMNMGAVGGGTNFLQPSRFLGSDCDMFRVSINGIDFFPKGFNPREYESDMLLGRQATAEFEKKHATRRTRDYIKHFDATVDVMKSEDLKVFELKRESVEMRKSYGMNRFGQSCLLARRLVERGTRVATVVHPGFDLHRPESYSEYNIFDELDRGFAALVLDLEQRGLLDTTLVVLATEFGRTPRPWKYGKKMWSEEIPPWRDHYSKCFSTVMAGGGVRKGVVYGKTDDFGESVLEKPVRPEDFNACIGHAFGIDPQQELYNHEGRPMSMGNKDGKVIGELFA